MMLGVSVLCTAQITPVCGNDPTCTPDPNGSGYAAAAAARTNVQNLRGLSSPLVATIAQIGPAVTIVGSQSYSYAIPILKWPGRAGTDLTLNLYYNSAIFDFDSAGGTITFNADRDFPSYGFRLDFGFIENTGAGSILTEGDGTKTLLSYGPALMTYSTDGRAIQYSQTTGILTYKNGLQIQYLPFPSNANLFRPVWIKDTNGNFISIAYVSGHDQAIYQISDTLGRVITFNYDGANRLTSLSELIHPSGSKTYVTFSWGTPYSNGYPWYNFSGLTTNGFPMAAQINVLTGCTYPDGTGYLFTYGDWAIINKIEKLSSSGATRTYVSYDYPLASAGALSQPPTYSHRIVSPDGGTGNLSVSTYSVTEDTSGNVTSMNLTDPVGTVSTTNIDPGTGLMSSTKVSDNGGHVLSTSNFAWQNIGVFPETSTVLSGKTVLNDTGQQATYGYTYDIYGNTIDVYEYGFGNVLHRHTITSYLDSATGSSDPNQAYISRHIVNLPTRVVVLDGVGNTISRTDMAYDGSSLTTVTGAASHDDGNFGVGFATRGNLTSITGYANAAAATGAVTRNLNYDTLGNVISAQLDCCNQKTLAFSNATQYSQPDSITRGLAGGPQFTTSYTYNPDNSDLLTGTDENGQTTQYQYDSMDRITQVTLPPQNRTSVVETTAYDTAAVSPTVTKSTTANSAITVTTTDGLGDVLQVDSNPGTAAASRVLYAYDKNWRRIQASNPFVPGDTVVNTAFSYDGLGRITTITPPSGGYTQYSYSGNTVTITDPAGKQRKNYFDALGRLIQVDEPGETFAGSPVSGTLTINGTLQGQTGSGSPATGTVTLGGKETEVPYCVRIRCVNVWNTGTVSITVNGHGDTVTYGKSDTQSTVASNLAAAINADSAAFVTAIPSGNVVTVTAKTAGTVGNSYGLSASSTTDDPLSLGFSPAFTGTPSGPALAGGVPGTTSFDSGTVNVTIGSFTASAPYSQSGNSTASQIATALVGSGSTGLNRSGSLLTATASGATIAITYNTVGSAGGNVAATATSASNDPTHFPSGSFNGNNSLTDGKNPYFSGMADPYSTTYTYDVMNHVTAASVAAGNVNGVPAAGQARSSTYDSMGRPISVTTPEAGTVYTYYTDASGNACSGNTSSPCRVQDPRGVVRTFTYDAINRPSSISYNDGTPGVTYTYDTGGAAAYALSRLTKVTVGANSQTFTYDNFGRVTSLVQVIDGNTYTISYSYNLASQRTSIIYPTGRVVTENVDPMGRLSSIADASTTYLSNLSYNAAGQTLGMTMGNGVQGTLTYNDHLQPASLRYFQSGNSTDILNLGYDYGTNNNGQIQAMHYYTAPGTEDPTKSEYFNYDPWSRLSSAQTGIVNSTAGTWSVQWGYDRFGNRLSQTLTGGNLPIGQPAFSVDVATNHITNPGYSYDANGNLTGDSVRTYLYDGANRLQQLNGTAAVYTYFGALRIKKVVGPTTTVYIYSGNQPIVEYTNGVMSSENIYRDTQLLATVTPGGTNYYYRDHLSTRAMTDGSGNVIRTSGTMPFGDTWYVNGTSTKWKFTDYERDAESGSVIDYAKFRYYHSAEGRFMSPDLLSGQLSAPQSLNRYSYVLNDPINLIDPFGLKPCNTYIDSNGMLVCEVWGTSDDGGGGTGHGTPAPLLDVTGFGGGSGPITHIDRKTALWICLIKLFKGAVVLQSLTEAVPGSNGQPGTNGVVTVTATLAGRDMTFTQDINTFNVGDLNMIRTGSRAPSATEGNIRGVTIDGARVTNWWFTVIPDLSSKKEFTLDRSYLGSDLGVGDALSTQMHELGHQIAQSLGFAKKNTEDPYARALEGCVAGAMVGRQ